MESVIQRQHDIIKSLEKINTNFKKDSADRKTSDYIKQRLELLDDYWQDFDSNHNQLQTYPDKSHEYFTKNMYQQVYDYYVGTREIIASFPVKSTLASTSIKNDNTSQVDNMPMQPDSKLKDLLSEQRTNFKALRRQVQNCVVDDIEEKWELDDELKNLQSRWEQIDKLHWKIDNLSGNSDAIYEMEFTDVERKYRDIKRQLNRKISSTAHLKDSTPRVDIPIFTGNYSQWPTFLDLFKETIHNNTTLSKTQKMQHLKGKLKGEAERLIQHLHISANNYDTAWEILYQRYNNLQLLFTKQMEIFLNQHTLQKQTSFEIKRLHDTSIECLHAIQNLGVDTKSWDPILVHLLSKKLDTETYRDYQESRRAPRELATLEELLSFLEAKFTALEPIRKKEDFGAQKQQTSASAKPQHKTYFRQEKPLYPINRAYHTSYKTITCPLCNMNHALYQCKKFESMTPDAKLNVISNHKICKNCLYIHEHNYCNSTKRCKICNNSHNTLLHDILNNNPLTKPSTSTSLTRPLATQHKNVNHVDNDNDEILLTTVQLRVQAANGTYMILTGLLDQGSQVSLVSENAVQRLGLPREHINASICGVGTTPKKGRGKVTLNCKSIHDEYNFFTEALVMPRVLNNLPNMTFEKKNYNHLRNLQLADPEYHISKPIDILLDARVYSIIIMGGLLKGSASQPIAQQTAIGWIISGSHTTTFNCHVLTNCDEDFSRFWEMEEVTENNNNLTPREQFCEDFYVSTTRRLPDGRYEVRYPMIDSYEQHLGPSKPKAVAQLKHLENKLYTNKQLGEQYHNFMQEYISLGHMRKCVTTKEPSCFLPHHPVYKEDSNTTKLRVVFNASSKTKSGYSLNDLMECGPKLHNDIQSLLINWRTFRYVYLADCEKMFRTILLNEEDQHLQKIMWRDESGNLQEYQLCTVTYGTKAAPFIAMRTMQQLAIDDADKYPLASKILLNNRYVDDILAGNNHWQIAKETQKQLIDMLQGAGMNMRKWSSNTPELLEHLSPDQLNPSVVDLTHADSMKALGLRWDPFSDTFKFKNKLQNDKKSDNQSMTKYTKRMMLSDMSKIFDPLGWLSPVVIKAKILFQRVWATEIGWDDNIAEPILQEWLKFREEMTYIENIDIPRWLGDTTKKVELHGFSDASEKALACCVYIKTKDNTDKQMTRLVAAKTKLTPKKKPESLPRLELAAAALLAKLLNKIITSIPADIDIELHGWTDSMVVLGWLHGEISRWKTFVANRVKQITDILPAARWRHTKSEDNAADCATRGLTPVQLKNHSLWWEGPSWLKEEISQSAHHYDIPKIDIKESKVHAVLLTPSSIILDLLNKHSSLLHIVRIICWVRRFGLHIRHRDAKQTRHEDMHLTADEMRSARQLIIINVQLHYFINDITRLSKGENLSSKSDILTLNPFIDDKGILRVGGRLRNSNLTYNCKHPILVPHDSPLTKLLIQEAHHTTLHGGPALTMTYLRQQYWIIGGIRAVKKQIRLCVKCRRFTPRSENQIMADLPGPRVTPSKCFTISGVDLTGYVEIKSNKGRGIKTSKAYIAVFVCFSTKAVHLELVSDLSSESFIAALKRMSARRGLPKHLYSDNGTNFVGASRILKREYDETLPKIDTAFLNEISQMGITWHFTAPLWASAGGLYEAAVKSVKFHLKRVIGEQKLTYEEFYTLLTQIEACLNSRPLYALSENLEDDYLTPGHFLTGGPLLSSPLSDVNGPSNLRTRWQLVQQMQNSFWKKWSTDYLHHLQKRFKWNYPKQNLKINDIVLIHEDNMPPSKWALGKVEEIHPGRDGYTRVVTLKTKSGFLKRPITKLSLLPVNETNDNKICDNIMQPPSDTDIPGPSTANTRSRRPRRGKLCNNYLVSALLLLMTFITPSLTQICNVTQLTQNNTLYFDKVADMRVVQDHWNMVVYYNMSMYWQSMTDIENYISHIKNISNNEVTFIPIISQFEHELKEIQHYNDIMSNKTLQHRSKRGLINGIGYVANSLFGVLDDRFAQQYEKDIDAVKNNENHLLAMFKNQTSILEAENNILKRNEAVMHQHFQYINDHLKNITHELNQVEKVTTNILQSIYVMATALSADVIISNVRRIQETLLDSITNIYHGQIDMHLISPDQLETQLHTISGHLPSELVLPSDNVRELYKLLHAQARMTNKFMIIEVKIPLLSLDNFELHKVISLPVTSNGRTIYNFPTTNHIAFNIKKDMIMPMTDNDIQKCIKYSNEKLLCQENHPIYNIHFKQSLCNIKLFTNNANQTYCRSEIRRCTDKWMKLNTHGAWLFSCCEECSVRILCPGALITKQLHGNGIIYIGQGCILKGDTFMIHIPYDYKNEVVLQPNIDVPEMPQYTSSLNELILTPITDSEIDKLENHERLFDEISQNIAVLKAQDLQQIQDDSTTHLTIIYSVLSAIILSILVYAVIKCRRTRRGNCEAREIQLTTVQSRRDAAVGVYETALTSPSLNRVKSASVMSVDTATSPSMNRKVTFDNLPKP